MSRPPTEGSSVGLPLILAVAGPLLVLAGAAAGLDWLARADERVALDNAGKVINGTSFPGNSARALMERAMELHDPRVVVFGNSLANTDLSAAVLESALELPTGDVQKFSVPGSIGAHWTAMLENRVIEAGHRPELAVIVSDWPSLLSVQPNSESSYLALVQHLDDDDPGFDELIGRRFDRLDRIRSDRGELRERIVGAIRRNSVRTLTGDSVGMDDALARVFAPDAIDPRLHRMALPIADPFFERAIPIFDPATIPHPSASFVPRLAGRAREAGISLVVVRPPMAPRLPPGIGDVVEPTTEGSLHGLLRSYGAWDLDLRALPVTDGDFVNLDHMNADGADRFTRVIADLVRRLGAWEGDDIVLDWLEPGQVIQGRYRPARVAARYGQAPPSLRGADRPLSASGPGWGRFDVDAWRFLSDRATRDVTPWASRCSPVRVLADGVALPRHHETCRGTARFGRGRVCHDESGLRFTTPDRSDPSTNGVRYTLALDPGRRCERAQWLYPEDTLVLRGAAPRRASVLSLRVHDQTPKPDPAHPAEVDVLLRQGARTLVEARVAAPGPPSAPARLELREPILPSAGAVELVVTSRSRRFLMLTEATLRP